MNQMFAGLDNVSASFISKAAGGPIQCADMLAWLHNNFVKRLQNGTPKPRADLQALIDNVDCVAQVLDRKGMTDVLLLAGIDLRAIAASRISGTYGGVPFGTDGI